MDSASYLYENEREVCQVDAQGRTLSGGTGDETMAAEVYRHFKDCFFALVGQLGDAGVRVRYPEMAWDEVCIMGGLMEVASLGDIQKHEEIHQGTRIISMSGINTVITFLNQRVDSVLNLTITCRDSLILSYRYECYPNLTDTLITDEANFHYDDQGRIVSIQHRYNTGETMRKIIGYKAISDSEASLNDLSSTDELVAGVSRWWSPMPCRLSRGCFLLSQSHDTVK